MEPTTIRKLFSDQDRKFKIPAYQRAYSWEKEHVLQFIQDLRDASQDYYLGHFLFEQEQEKTVAKPSAANTLLIIDGQQRLTTCIIFFSSLYQELTKKQSIGEVGSIDREDIVHIYLRDVRKGTQKLETVSDDNNFFADEIIDRKHTLHPSFGTKSQERIRDARVLFSDAFSEATLAELERWHGLVSDATCTEYRVADKIGAARIFAFQNDRGKRLSDLEVLKSYFMLQVYLHGGEATDEHLKYLESEITTIYRQIVRIDLKEDEVLRYCWVASSPYSKGFDSEKTVDEIKAYVTACASSETCGRIKGFMTALANSFRLVEKIEKSEATKIKNLSYLNTMALAYPFLIRAWNHGASEEQVERLAGLLENVTFRALLRGGRAGIESRLNVYLRMAADEIYVETLVLGVVQALRFEGWWSYWSDQVLDTMNSGYFYKNRVDNYVLWRYEMHLCSKSGYPASLKVGYENLIGSESIEHIAPQTESDGAPVANGYGVYDDAGNPENGIASGEWMNCLGNLMLISQSHNSSIGNRPFETKVASYGKDNLLNQQKEIISFVADASKPVWDKGAIERRHIKILGVAKTLWSLDNL